MQRIAVGLLTVAALAVCGCQPAGRAISLGPVPAPVLATRGAARPVQPIPRPRAAAQPSPETTWLEPFSRSWFPSQGIEQGRWRVIVVHHSGNARATPQSMHNYHLKQRGWCNGLGYHFVIGNGVNYPDGRVHVGARWRKQQTGAHCKSKGGRHFGAWHAENYFNEHGIGICLIGNFEEDWPTRKQLASLVRLLTFLCEQNGISPSSIRGHGEVTHKTLCPGKHLDLEGIRQSTWAALAR
jgi:hypothetical protein